MCTCSVSPFLTLSSCEFRAWKSYRARTGPRAGSGDLGVGRGGWINTQPGPGSCPKPPHPKGKGTLTLGWDCPSSRCPVAGPGPAPGKGVGSELGKLRQALGCPGGPRAAPAPSPGAATRPKKPGCTRAPGRCWGTRPCKHRGRHRAGCCDPPQTHTRPSRCRGVGPHLDLFQAVPRLFQTP